MELSKEHIRLWIFHEYQRGSSPTDAIKNICSIYGTNINESNVKNWYQIFRKSSGLENRTQLENLRKILAEEPNINVHKLARKLQLSYLTVQKYLKSFAEAPLPSSDEDEENLEDEDTCNAFELEQFFKLKYRISEETVVTLKKDYVLSLCQDSAYTRLAAGLSNGEVQIFDINGDRNLSHANMECIPAPVGNQTSSDPINICGVQFLDNTSADCLLIGTTNGLVRLYDLRTQRVEARFEEDIGGNKQDGVGRKNITCFERNANSRVLCTGTEQYQNSVHLIFYDIRERKQLGGYFESHQDDITSLRFHSRNPDLLSSGSTDGLINIFNIKESNEDDALLTTINTESSVHKLNWHKNVYDKDIISCITHTNDFKTYECDEGDSIAEFERSNITSSMKRKNPANCNLINAHDMEDGGIFLLAGTNYKKGEVLRTLHLQNKQLLPLADFDGNKQIVRESVFNAKNQALITAGESGIVTLWTPESFGKEGHTNTISNKLKSKTKLNSSKRNPY